MSIFESLENLNVSEECFDDIMGIVEEILIEGYTQLEDTLKNTVRNVIPKKIKEISQSGDSEQSKKEKTEHLYNLRQKFGSPLDPEVKKELNTIDRKQRNDVEEREGSDSVDRQHDRARGLDTKKNKNERIKRNKLKERPNDGFIRYGRGGESRLSIHDGKTDKQAIDTSIARHNKKENK